MGWPRGEAADCKSVYRGSNPLPTSCRGSRRADMLSEQCDLWHCSVHGSGSMADSSSVAPSSSYHRAGSIIIVRGWGKPRADQFQAACNCFRVTLPLCSRNSATFFSILLTTRHIFLARSTNCGRHSGALTSKHHRTTAKKTARPALRGTSRLGLPPPTPSIGQLPNFFGKWLRCV